MSRLHIVSTIVFLMALSVYGYIQWQKSNETAVSVIDSEDLPDFIAKSLNTNKYDSEGNLTHTIYAEQMAHYSANNETFFQQPQYTIYPKDGSAAWNLSANSGNLTKDNILLLRDRVRLISQDKHSFISEIHAKAITVNLNDNIITSEQTILLKGQDFTMYGSGLHVDINTTKMTLSEHVQTIFKKHAS
ncbi:LPS export ABC transporter periplasmic protein LptC [Thalassotalea sp. ND16A]|uniref:LPS export ABC transporter periplasmic protein LptC n=1 Tax=Thalassotalea sp. ND16A TaxID=1535422 RepID=UPI00051A4C1B|nr:LPS export ABC transporter periplasmic protein LptC [Thalassotalea sp. ND16A]KGJ98964.1 hypothetical protein ND16A_0486 [Thalassotalea sp. ND16A]